MRSEGGLGFFIKDVEVARADIKSPVFSAGAFCYNAQRLECGEHFLGGMEGHASAGGYGGGGGDGMALEVIHEAQGGASEVPEAAHLLLMPLKDREEALRSARSLCGYNDAGQAPRRPAERGSEAGRP